MAPAKRCEHLTDFARATRPKNKGDLAGATAPNQVASFEAVKAAEATETVKDIKARNSPNPLTLSNSAASSPAKRCEHSTGAANFDNFSAS
ncbi:hypothetical protein [Slackia isoflavoniconvertens]|uniref:hypothetical protein n=1 Tax=Slackia isoflavoniconvertens TaxID=572010 RepID=UPI003AAB06E4